MQTSASTLRFVCTDDAARIAAIYAPFVDDAPTSFEERAPSGDEIARRIERCDDIYPWLVAEHAGDVAGYAYAAKHRERPAYRTSVDVSVYLDERFRSVGTGRRLYQAMFAILSLQGYYTAYAGVSLPNAASVAFHRKLGFTPIGVYHNVGYKAGAWRDTLWLERSLRPNDSPPVTIRRISELDRSDFARIFHGGR